MNIYLDCFFMASYSEILYIIGELHQNELFSFLFLLISNEASASVNSDCSPIDIFLEVKLTGTYF